MSPTDSSRAAFRRAWVAAATFGTLLSVGMTGLVVLARGCLENPTLLVALCPLVMTAAVLAPFLLPTRWQDTAPRFVYALLTLAVLLSPMLVVVTGRWLGFLYPILAAVGLVRVAPRLKDAGWGTLAWSATAALAFAPYLLTQILSQPYAHIFLPEFALLGPEFVAQDTLYHTSMAHMMQSFGRASRGLDGLVPYPYHVASHAWLGFIGRITDSTPFFVFPFVQAGLSVPALLTSALLATACLARRGERPVVSAAVALALVLAFDFGWTSHYISESQTLGLCLTLLGLPLLADVVQVPERSPGADGLRMMAAVAIVFTTMATKISAGVLLGAGFGWAVLRRPGGRRIAFLAVLGATVLLALLWFQTRNTPSLGESIEPFSYFRRYGPEHWRSYLTFVLPILYIGAVLARRRLDRWGEVILVMTVLALLPGFLVHTWGTTSWWFWNAMHWIVVALIAAAATLPRGRLGSTMAWALLACVIALPLTRTDVVPVVALAARLAPSPPTSVRQYAWEWFTACDARLAAPIAARLRDAEGTRFLAALRALQPADRRGVAIFIPPSNQAYWDMEKPWACRRRAWYVPALTGLPLLKGIGPDCPLWVASLDAGFSEYDTTGRTTATDDEELCRHAWRRGVDTVIVLESIDEPARNHVLSCAGEGRRPRPLSMTPRSRYPRAS